jgi:SAM-dependent methyltransferase
MSKPRNDARNLAKQYTDAGKPLEWFEVLYARAKAGEAIVPWADLKANPNLIQWFDSHEIQGQGKTALTIGCGLGDDVEELADRGFQAIGFDISNSAIEWCQSRFPNSTAQYIVADLLNPPTSWRRSFDFVFECYTLQSLPHELRQKAIDKIADFVAPEGQLLVICRGRDIDDVPAELPYPLTRNELMQFRDLGLSLEQFEDYLDEEDPPVRQFRAEFRKPQQDL